MKQCRNCAKQTTQLCPEAGEMMIELARRGWPQTSIARMIEHQGHYLTRQRKDAEAEQIDLPLDTHDNDVTRRLF